MPSEEKVQVKNLYKIRKKLNQHGHPEWIVETEYIADVLKDMQPIIGKKGSIFQPGCGCGYVLDALWEVGYRNLTGLDKNVVKTVAGDADKKDEDWEEWNPKIKFIHSTIGALVDSDNNNHPKEVLDTLPQYDVVLCHRFLHVFPNNKPEDSARKLYSSLVKKTDYGHVHDFEAEWLFEKIASKSRRFLVILENEEESINQFWHHYKRNYKEVFEKYGFEQIFEEVNLFPFQNWEIKTMVMRVFKRK